MSKATHPVLITFSKIREYIKEEPDHSPSCSDDDDDEMMEGDGVFKSHLVLGETDRASTKRITHVNLNKELRFGESNSKQINEEEYYVEEEAVEEDVDNDSDKRKDRDSYYITRSNPKRTHGPSFKPDKDQVDHEVREIRKCGSCSRGGAPQGDLCDLVETGQGDLRDPVETGQGDLCDPVETGQGDLCDPVETGQGDLCDPVETGQGDLCDPVETGQGDLCDPVETGRHKCSVCGKRFSVKKHLIDHYPAHIEPQYRCVVCSEWFLERDALARHYNAHIEPPGFNCTDCGSSFATREGLLAHFPLRKEKVQFKCLECGICMWTKRVLLIHYTTHVKPNKERCECGECKKCHRRAVRFSERPGACQEAREYRCEECDARFATKFMLLNHRQKQHRMKTCGLCGRRFKKRATLLKHTSLHYKQKVECGECGKVYVSSRFPAGCAGGVIKRELI